MNIILNTLKCKNCLEILSQPVLLPCGHYICKSHTQIEKQEQVTCLKCGTAHSSKESFFVSNDLSDLIAAQLASLDFGTNHKESIKSCEELRNQLKLNDLILDDPDYFIHESVQELKCKVQLKSEKLKLQIDDITQELLDELDEFKARCEENYKNAGTKNETFEKFEKKFKRLNEDVKVRVNNWSNVLNELRVNEAKWREIKVECEKTIEDLRAKVERFQRELLTNEFVALKNHVAFFENLDINSLFVKDVKYFYLNLKILKLKFLIFNFLNKFEGRFVNTRLEHG